MNAVQIALLGSGLFFISGMLTGLWKYRCIMRSPDAQAPVYVDICHRASLMYAFACLVFLEFAERSTWPERVNQIAVAVPILFFASAVATYLAHGWLRDTDNQLRRPHVLGAYHVHGAAISAYMIFLTGGEVGGFLVLFSGWARSL
jgi:hypothetical protein